jgi:hypothetical protein
MRASKSTREWTYGSICMVAVWGAEGHVHHEGVGEIATMDVCTKWGDGRVPSSCLDMAGIRTDPANVAMASTRPLAQALCWR